MPPRAAFTIITPFFIFLSAFSPIRFLVSGVSGACTVMKSARSNSASSVHQLDAEARRAIRAEHRVERDHVHLQALRAVGDDAADVAHADDRQRLARDLGALELGLLPLAVLDRRGGLTGILRASDISRLSACSAVVTALPVGVFITTTPLRLAAGTSTLSTPMPARPITCRPSARSITLAVTFEPLRMISAS